MHPLARQKIYLKKCLASKYKENQSNIYRGKAVNREDKRSRRYRDQHFAKFERSRRYRDRYRC